MDIHNNRFCFKRTDSNNIFNLNLRIRIIILLLIHSIMIQSLNYRLFNFINNCH